MEHEVAARIDGLLDRHRPERYDTGDTTWRNPVYKAIASTVPVAQAVKIAAEYLVDQREGVATKQANALLREVGKSKQWPLDWMDAGRRPIAVGNTRVRLDAATAEDFKQFEIDERRRAAADFNSRNQACDGAQWIAEQLTAGGWSTFGEGCSAQLGESA